MLEGVKKAPDAVVSLRSGNVIYDLPLSAINLESLTKGLTDPSNALSFTQISGHTAEQLTAQSKLAGLPILTNPIEFTITVSDKGSNTEVNDFNSYVSRTIIIGSTDLSTDHMTAVSCDAATLPEIR